MAVGGEKMPLSLSDIRSLCCFTRMLLLWVVFAATPGVPVVSRLNSEFILKGEFLFQD